MKKTIILALSLALLLTLTACSGGELNAKFDPQTGGVEITADNASRGLAVGELTLGEGECLVVSPLLDKGYFLLELRRADDPDRIVESRRVEGRAMSTLALDPGTYELRLSVERRTSGTLSLLPRSQAQVDAENASLIEALENAFPGFDLGGGVPGFYHADAYTVFAERKEDGECRFLVTVSLDNDANSTWEMGGRLDPDTQTVEYSDAVRTDYALSADGGESAASVAYENGAGRFVFHDDGTLTWEDDMEKTAAGLVFESGIPGL